MPDLHSVNWWLVLAVVAAAGTWFWRQHEFEVHGFRDARRKRNRHRAVTCTLAAVCGIGLVVGIPAEARAGHGGVHCKAINHRGLTATGLENQPAGVTLGGKWGMAEVDADVTSDGQIVAVHDKRLGRLTDGDLRGYVNEYTLEQMNAESVSHPFGKFRLTTALIARAASDNVPVMVTINRWNRIGQMGLRNQVLDILYAAAQQHPRPHLVHFGGYGPQDAMRLRHPDASTFWRYKRTDTRAFIRENSDAEGIRVVALPEAHYAAGLVADLKAAGHIVATRQVLNKTKARAAQDAGINWIQGNDPERVAKEWCR